MSRNIFACYLHLFTYVFLFLPPRLRAAYFSRDFDSAAKGFQEVITLRQRAKPAEICNVEDEASVDAADQLLWERCKKYAASGVPDDWDGCEVLKKKTW